MKVLLLRDVNSLGKRGEIVNVANGYARNYLIPRGLAVEATEGIIKNVEQQLRETQRREAKRRREMEEAIKRLAEERLIIPVAMGKEGKLFGSVGTKEIANALAEKGIKVDRRHIDLESPLKHIGIYKVRVRFGEDLHGEITVELVPKEGK